MRKYYKAALLFITALFLLSGCSAPFNEAKEETRLAAEEAFKVDPKEANNENEHIEYYLPFGFEIEEENPSNIIIKNGAKKYVLFYNPIEDSKSEVVFNSSIEQVKYDLTEVFSNDDRFGYLLIKKLDDDLNELTVGVGGIKVTNFEVKTRSLKSEVTAMVNIVNAAKIKK